MNTSTRAAALALVLLAGLSAGACSSDANSASKQASSENANGAAASLSSADRAVLALLDEDDQAGLRRNPIGATRRGDRRYDALLPDLSPRAEAQELAENTALLARLEKIDRAALSKDNALNAMLLERSLKDRIEGARFNGWQQQVTPMDGPHQDLPQMPDSITFITEKHYEDYCARLESIPGYLDQSIANMREGLKAGNTPAKVVMGKAHEQALEQGDARFETDPTQHDLYRPFQKRGKDDALAARARKAIAQGAVPGFRGYGVFLRDEYIPGCRETIACADLPDGAARYRYALRVMTTTDMTPEQIHDKGLAEVARIRAEMMQVIARSDFPEKNSHPGGGDDLFRAFLNYLRTDKRFVCRTADELLLGYRDVAKQWDAEMPRLFGRMPRLPYGVREMPLFIAPSQTTAFYQSGSLKNGQAGYFVANTYKLEERPKYDMVPLTLHEASPGHHHQIALAQEMENVPEWRKHRWHTAYGEGWGLYSERLGLEVGEGRPDSTYAPIPPGAAPTPRVKPGEPGYKGMYQHPYDDFGRLTYEMWRAMRLVVDTGMHAKGWARDRAIRFMLDNSGLTRENVEREVDRYIAWPGQACAYKIGELKIRELREGAEKALGPKFDVRSFHDCVLGSGSVPLSVLEAMVQDWTAARAGAS